ncbi:MAG: hypothetical protein K5907_00565 [Treponema sp.]|nr:hypothetical protein [Treponema sp.]
MIFFVISVLTLNLILWAVFLIRFKKLFSTDQIIEKTEEKMNHFVREIDMAADRDTYLAKETSKRLKSMLDDADQKMELFKEASQRLRDMIAEADKINKGKAYSLNEIIQKKSIEPDDAFELTLSGTKKETQQGSLFEQNKESVKSIQKNRTNVTPDGAAYHEIPLIITKVYDEEKPKLTPEEIKKNMKHLVRKLLDEGAQADEIAQKLNCSITEIQFIIDML